MKNDYDTKEKLERTDVGYRLTIESTRGTGTRDQDKVKAELRSEEFPPEPRVNGLKSMVKATMTELREHQPDGDDDE